MKKIVNWTFGSVFRTFGRVLAYILIGVLFSFIMSKSGLKITNLLGIDTIKAAEVNTNYEKYSVRMYSTDTLSEQWSSFMDTGSNFTTQDSDLYLRAFRVRYGSNDKFLKGKTYRVKVNVLLNNGNSSRYKNVNNVVCYGSTTNSFDMNTGFIDTCQFIAKTLYEDNTRAHYYFDIKPNTDLYSIQVQFYYSDSSMYQLNMTSVSPLQVGTGTNVTYDDSDINAINNQTTDILNNNNQNTQDIINNNNENTQNIINSQNELMGNKCENFLNLDDIITGNICNDNGGLCSTGSSTINSKDKKTGKIVFNIDQSWGGITTNYIEAKSNTKYYFNYENNQGNLFRVASYNSSKTLISYSDTFNNSRVEYTTPNNTKFIRIQYNSANTGSYTINNFSINEKSYNFCEYGSYSSKLDDTNKSINDLKDSITDSSSPSISGLSNDTVAGWLPPGPVDSILNLPLTLINSLINGMSGSCAPLRVPLPYVNMELPIPCMSTVYSQMGFATFFNWVGNIAAAFILFKYLLKLYKYVDDTLTFRENNFIDNWSGV